MKLLPELKLEVASMILLVGMFCTGVALSAATPKQGVRRLLEKVVGGELAMQKVTAMLASGLILLSASSDVGAESTSAIVARDYMLRETRDVHMENLPEGKAMLGVVAGGALGTVGGGLSWRGSPLIRSDWRTDIGYSIMIRGSDGLDTDLPDSSMHFGLNWGIGHDLHGDRLAPMLFYDIGVFAFSPDFVEVGANTVARSIAGWGVEFSKNFSSSEGRERGVLLRLKAGAGVLANVNDNLVGSADVDLDTPHRFQQGLSDLRHKNEYFSDVDFDTVGALQATFEFEGVSMGDVLHKSEGSAWHWLPFLPATEAHVSLYQPMFDGNEDSSPVVSLRGQIKLIGRLYGVYERMDSPHFVNPYTRFTALMKLLQSE